LIARCSALASDRSSWQLTCIQNGPGPGGATESPLV
jgi:hypothetical protein